MTVRAGGLNRYTHGLAGGLHGLRVHQRWLVVADTEGAVVDERLEIADWGDGGRGAACEVRAVAGAGEPLRRRWAGMRAAFDLAVREWRAVRGRGNLPEGAEESRVPDLVVSHFALYAWPARRRLGRAAGGLPHVVHFHGPWADESAAEGAGRLATAAKRASERAVYRTGDRFVVLSQAFRDVLVRRYGVAGERVAVVPGGMDVGAYAVDASRGEARERLGWPTDRQVVLSVRRLSRRMGLDVLVDAAALMRDRVPDVLVLIGGRGAEAAALLDRIAARGLGDHVKLVGFVPEEHLALAYRAADVSVVPSRALEGFGLVAAESLAAGTPALVTNVGGLPEVVRDLDERLIVEPESPAALADALAAALSGDWDVPDAAACQAYVRDRFDWSVVAPKVLGVYREAIEAHREG